MRRHSQNQLFLYALLIITFFLFLPSLEFDFINWDDDVHIVNNPFILSFGKISGFRDLLTITVNKTYNPLTWVMFGLEYQTFGPNPFIFHLNSVLLHIAVTVLVFVFVSHLGCSPRVAFITAVIFGIHPSRVESVAWITSRKDVLYAFFYLSSLVFYCRHLKGFGYSAPLAPNVAEQTIAKKKPCIWLFPTAAICALLSALAKPMALSLPLIMALLDWLFRRKISLRTFNEKFIVCLLVFPVVGISYILHADVFTRWFFPQSVFLWLWTAVYYIGRFLFPIVSVHFITIPRPVSLEHPVYLLSMIGGIALLVALLYFRRKRALIFIVLWYFLSMFFLFRTSVAGHLHMVADRYMYLPSLGFCLAIGLIYEGLILNYSQKTFGTVVKGALFVGIVGLSYLSLQQMEMWRDSQTFWQTQYKRDFHLLDPVRQAIVCSKYAEAKIEDLWARESHLEIPQEEVVQIRSLLEESLIYNESYSLSYYYIGKVEALEGNWLESIRRMKEAIEKDPQNFDAYIWMGKGYLVLGRENMAILAMRMALEKHPDGDWLVPTILKEYQAYIQRNPKSRLIAREIRDFNKTKKH